MTAAPTYQTIGKPIPRVEGFGKVTGRALYSADVSPPGVLWARNVCSPHPHARIVSIDTSRARAIPGVRAVLTAADIPLKRTGRNLKDMSLLASDVVRYVGEKVAVVAAETPQAAEEAALAVDTEYEELPAIFDPLAAMQPGAPVVHPNARSYAGFPHAIPPGLPNVCGYRLHELGDVQAGFAASDLVVEHTFTTQLSHQAYLEPSACVVAIDADQRVDVWPANKLPYLLRDQVAELIDRPSADVVIYPTVVGGDFGAKGGPMDVPMAYQIARLTGRPVKFVATAQEDLVGLSHRHPSVISVRTGICRDGTIVAREVRIVYNTGAYGALKPSEDGMLTGADYAGGPYEIPHLRIEAFCVYTNQPPCGYMRAPGHPQVAFAVEAHTDLLAREVGLDPLDFRLHSVSRRSPTGEEGLAATVLRAAADALGWGEARGSSPIPARLRGHGIALIERGVGFGEGSSDLTLNPDGTVTVVSGLPDNGTGALTVVAQVVAQELGLPFDQVRLERGTTDALPTDVGSAADRMTNVAGHAAIAGTRQLKAQLGPLAAAMLGTDEVEWDGTGWRSRAGRFASLQDLAIEAIVPGMPEAHAQVTVDQPKSPARGYCAQAAEVEVDPDTGQVQVRRMVSAQDTGTVINTLGHQGQVEGGLVQGVGYALMEEMSVEDGRIVNPQFAEYKIPTARDIPQLITVDLASVGTGPYQAKAIGEVPCVPTAGAIANAVAAAIGAPIQSLPITPERVLTALSSLTNAVQLRPADGSG